MAKSVEPVTGQQSEPNVGGRPSVYTPDVAADLCAYLAMGESLRTACAHEGMPGISSVFRWLSKANEEEWAAGFREQYACAKEEAADAMAEEILYIADNQEVGEIEVTRKTPKGEFTEKRKEDMLGHRRLQIDTRKWLAAKLKPKRYGDKVDITSDNEKLGVAVTPEQAEQLLRLRAKRGTTDTPN